MESEHLGKPLLQPNFDKYWRGLSSTRVKAGEAEPRDLTDWFGCSRKYDTQRREKWYVGTIVVALEKVVHKLRGGNTRFNGGLFRSTYAGLDDLMALIRGHGDVRVDPYSAQDFLDDIARVTGGHADTQLTDTLRWMANLGVAWEFNRAVAPARRRTPTSRGGISRNPSPRQQRPVPNPHAFEFRASARRVGGRESSSSDQVRGRL